MQVDKNAQPLSQLKPWTSDNEGLLGVFDCWPYTIVDTKPKNKDERVEDACWQVICLRVFFAF